MGQGRDLNDTDSEQWAQQLQIQLDARRPSDELLPLLSRAEANVVVDLLHALTRRYPNDPFEPVANVMHHQIAERRGM